MDYRARVLCIDDESGVVELVSLILKSQNILVEGAESGADGLAAMRQTRRCSFAEYDPEWMAGSIQANKSNSGSKMLGIILRLEIAKVKRSLPVASRVKAM